MKLLLFCILMSCMMIACNKKNDDKPQDPPAVVCGPNQHQLPGGACVDNPVECPEGQHEEGGQCVDDVEEGCPEALPGVFVCYDWGKCKGLFATFEEAAAIGAEMNPTGCHKVDGEVTQGGFGPCSQCHSIKPDGTVPYTIPFSEVLRQRTIMWLTK